MSQNWFESDVTLDERLNHANSQKEPDVMLGTKNEDDIKESQGKFNSSEQLSLANQER